MAGATSSRLGLAEAWGRLNQVRLNQDKSCFVCSFEDGLRVYSIDPVRERAHLRQDEVGSVAFAEMLHRTNLIALVSGGGQHPMFATNVCMIYDDLKHRMIMEVVIPQTQPILAVRLKRDALIIVSRCKIHVFSFPNQCKKLYTITTKENPRGICEVSCYSSGGLSGPSGSLPPLLAAPALSEPLTTACNQSGGGYECLVFPGYKTGSIQIVNMATTEKHVSSAPVTINAHQNELCCIALNQQGTIIASASAKGTLIRIWDAVRRCMLVELRRGTDQATVYCMNFSLTDEWLCCSSDKGTVHVFALQDYKLNKRSALASIGVPGAYACSQWSLANFTVPQEVACVCAFGTNPLKNADGSGDVSQLRHQRSAEGTIFAICLDGSIHKYHFSADGVCNQVAYDVFTDLCEDCEWHDMRKQ